MIQNLSITKRFVYSIVFVIILATSIALGFIYSQVKATLLEAEQAELNEVSEIVQTAIAAEGRMAQVMSALVAGIPQVQGAFADRDREWLSSYFVAGFPALKKEFGVRQFQFHEPPATSFLRVHKPAKFGDDLSSFRQTVIETNSSKKVIKGLEVGVAGLGIRGLSPVFHQGAHIGSVEFGMSLGQDFFDNFKQEHDVDLALFINRSGQLDEFANTHPGEYLFSTQEKLDVMRSGEVLFGIGDLKGHHVSSLISVVENFSGDPIGVMVVSKDRNHYESKLNGIQMLMLGAGVVFVLLTAVIVSLISRSIVAELCKTTRSMEEIASGEGDLSARLTVKGNDEVAHLSRAFNKFVDKIEGLVSQVSATTGSLGSLVSEFSNLSEHTDMGVKKQQEQATLVATAMTEMSATVHDVAQNTAATASSAVEADSQASAGLNVVSSTRTGVQTLADEVGRAVDVVMRVQEDSERIGTVLDVIRGIAEQTNLLALNAAIEAARAGEQGRGFAVVADEVRSLAQRTQQSTQEIQEMIESLQAGVSKAVGVMQESQDQASSSVEQADSAMDSLNAIVEAIGHINAMSTQIATAAEEQSVVAEDINQNVINISHLADQTAEDSRMSSDASERLAQQIEELVGLVGQFHFSGSNKISLALSRAKASHLAWKTKLRGFLDGKATLDTQSAFSGHDCAFGKWYDTEGKSEIGHMPEFTKIEPIHHQMHDLIKKIYNLKQQGDIQAAEAEYQKVGPMSEEIVSLISDLERHL